MYAGVRQVRAKPGVADELARRIKAGAIARISSVPGFRAYYVIYTPDDMVTAVSVFDTVEAAEEANARALAWINRELQPLLAGTATAIAGPVIAHATE